MFAPMLVGAGVGVVAAGLQMFEHYRAQLGPMTVTEARKLASMKATPIAMATDGYVKLEGVIVPTVTEMSYYNHVPCVVLEMHHYEVRDARNGSRRLLTRSEKWEHLFFIEDETGRVAIDPKLMRIDHEREGTDLESTIEEHRLRVGERVAVLGHVRRTGPKLTQPMRQASHNIEGGLEVVEGAVITWRTEPEVYPRLRPPGGGVALSAGSTVLAVIGSLLDL